MSMHWERSEGDDTVIYGYQDRYTARIVEGRVWRWQVGDDREPARLSGRTTRGMGEAQEACALAVRLLELSDAGADVEGLPAGEAVTRAMVDDLRDQIGERDGVIAQLRASLESLQALYDERGAKILEVIADNDALRGDAPQIKVGDRVLWRSYRGDLVGTVTRVFDTPDGLACEVVGEHGGCVALAWALEVVG